MDLTEEMVACKSDLEKTQISLKTLSQLLENKTNELDEMTEKHK